MEETEPKIYPNAIKDPKFLVMTSLLLTISCIREYSIKTLRKTALVAISITDVLISLSQKFILFFQGCPNAGENTTSFVA